MPFIFITGPTGTGKSSVRNELLRRGYEAHDADEDGMSAWYDNQTLEPVERPEAEDRPADWYEKHDYMISAERVKELAERGKTKLVYLCGIPANDTEFVDYYDKIICLVIDTETMKQRVLSRDTNDYGQSPDELKFSLLWHDKIIERYKNLNAIMIDATQPLNVVVEEIIKVSNISTR